MTETELRRAYSLAMTEDDLMVGLMEALTFGGWRWTHIRDSRGITVGHSGLPDLMGVHEGRRLAIAWECKAALGVVTSEQAAWIRGYQASGIDARVIRPDDYDDAIAFALGSAAQKIRQAMTTGRP